MFRTLPTGLLFLLVSVAHAQEADSLVAPAPADSLHLARLGAGSLPPFTTVQPFLSRVAGVQVTPYSGAPGAWAAVRIRGTSNVTGYSQPLYVVDDVPVYNTEVTPETWYEAHEFMQRSANNWSTPAVTPFAPGGNPLLDLPVEDIASVEVLQDAAATARYGVQGGNGVVRITTRRGANGQASPQPLRVRYAGYVGLQQVRQRYALLDGPQFAALANMAWANSGQTGTLYEPQEVASRGTAEWQDQLFRTAALTGHNLSIDGRTATTAYYVAADFLQQSGVLVHSSLTRYSLRANVDQHITPKLTLGLKVAGSQLDQRQPGADPDAGSLIQRALLNEPLGTEYDAQGLPLYASPVLTAETSYRAPRSRRLLAQLSAAYELGPGLTLSVRGSREQATVRDKLTLPTPAISGNAAYRSLQTETSLTQITNWVAAASLSYQHTFAQRHALTASLDYLRQQYSQEWSDTTRTVALPPPGSPPRPYSTSLSYYQYEVRMMRPLQSPSFAASYVFDGRYEVLGSLRADYASNGPGKGQALWFPGAQVRWHLGHEPFMAAVPGLGELTLQVGTGRTAGGISPLGRSSLLGPDRTTQVDAGVQTAWLGRRLTFAATVYQRRTEHVLANYVLPVSGGGFFSFQPDVLLRNRGLLLTLCGTWQRGPVQGSTNVAAAASFNRIEEIAEVNTFTGQRTPVAFLPIVKLETGQPLNRYFVVEQTLSANGVPQYSGPTGTAQGTGLPRYTLNLTQELHYQRFGLEAQLDGLFGYEIFNPTLRALDSPTGFTNGSQQVLNYWTPANPNTTTPRPSRTLPFPALTSQQLASGNHVRLTQLIVSYEVLNAATRKVSLWAGGQNLLVTGTYRGYDPNVSSGGASPLAAGTDAANYPVARVWQLGVRGQF